VTRDRDRERTNVYPIRRELEPEAPRAPSSGEQGAPRCPACLGAAVALSCGHCPRCACACALECMHCGCSFRSVPGGGWVLTAPEGKP
jgi:hypothetical protein